MNDPAVLVDTPFEQPGDKNIQVARALNLGGATVCPFTLAMVGSLLEKYGSIVITNGLATVPGESASWLGFEVVTRADGKQCLVSKDTLRNELP